MKKKNMAFNKKYISEHDIIIIILFCPEKYLPWPFSFEG